MTAADSPPPKGAAAVEGLWAVLSAHRPGDPRESLSMSIMAAELGRLDRPFDEAADLTHVTSSAIVVGQRGIVLHRHRRLHRWLQPGGHLESGESPAEAAIRETIEETGLDVAHPPAGPTMIHVDVHRAAEDHVHLDLRYLLWSADQDPNPGPGESQDVAWFTWGEGQALADDALAGALRAARRLFGSSPGWKAAN